MYYTAKFFKGGFALSAWDACVYWKTFLFIVAFLWFVLASRRSGCLLDCPCTHRRGVGKDRQTCDTVLRLEKRIRLSWFTRSWSLQLGWTLISRVKGNLMFLCCFIQMIVSCCNAWKYWSYIQTIVKLIQALREHRVAEFLFFCCLLCHYETCSLLVLLFPLKTLIPGVSKVLLSFFEEVVGKGSYCG